MNTESQLAWTIAAVGISCTASLILLGIWRKGYSHCDPVTGTKVILREDGVMWLFWACTLWCFTSVAQVAQLLSFVHVQQNSLPLTFIRIVLSLTNSLFFILATSNLDAVRVESGRIARLLEQ